MGYLQRRKGIDTLIRAVADLNESLADGKKAHLTIVGDAPDRSAGWPISEIEDFASSRGLGDHVELTGFLSDPEELADRYASAHMLVHPARMEGFPRVIDEAMLAGLPVLASRIPQITSVLTHERDALLFDPDDHHDLSRQIARLVTDHDLMDELIDASDRRARILKHKRAAAQHVDLIRELQAGR